MTMVWIVAGAVFGAAALGFSGFILGAGLGYGLALLVEVRQRLNRLESRLEERSMQRRRQPLPPLSSSAPAPFVPPAAGEEPPADRYPEETIIDALRDAPGEPESTAAKFDDVQGRAGASRSPAPEPGSRD